MKTRDSLKLAVAMLVAAGTLSSTWADDGPGTKRLSLDAGAAFPTAVNNFSDTTKTGLLGGVQYLYHLNYYTSVGVQMDFFSFAGKTHTLASSAGGRLNARSDASVATLELVGRHTFNPQARYMPYVHAGLGMNSFRQTNEGEPAPGSAWPGTNTTETRQLPDVNTVGVALSIGAGVETNLSERLVLGLETVWHILGVSKTAYGTSLINFPSLALRLGWRFGQEPLPPGP